MTIDEYHSVVISEIDNFSQWWKSQEDKEGYPENLPFEEWKDHFSIWQTVREDYER